MQNYVAHYENDLSALTCKFSTEKALKISWRQNSLFECFRYSKGSIFLFIVKFLGTH